MSTAAIPSSTRARTLARIHAAAKIDSVAMDTYKANLKKRTGQESCAELTDAELAEVAAATRQTQKQCGHIWHLCREIGLEGGTAGDAFKSFVSRTLKTTDPDRALRYLTRTQGRNLITALLNWKRSLAQRGALPEGDAANKKAPADDTRQGSTLSTSPTPPSSMKPASEARLTLPR